MICVKALVRQVEDGEHARALSRVLGNGRTSERRLQAWLKRHPRELPVVALGFALTRLAELTYGPTDEGSRLAERLLNHQQLEGGFGVGSLDPVSTAVALCGLLFHLDQYRQLGLDPDARLAEGADRAASVLVDWIIGQRAAHETNEELAIVRSQLEATMVLGISARDMLHEVGVAGGGECAVCTAQSAAA
jgi:hypothetical protein